MISSNNNVLEQTDIDSGSFLVVSENHLWGGGGGGEVGFK